MGVCVLKFPLLVLSVLLVGPSWADDASKSDEVTSFDLDLKSMQASIWHRDVTSGRKHFLCGGSVVAQDHVLTHAECVSSFNASELVVAEGRSDLTSTVMFTPVAVVTTQKDTGMTLLRTTADLFLASSVIKLRDSLLVDTSVCLVGGWLQETERYMEKDMKLVDLSNCNESHSEGSIVNGNVCASEDTDGDANNCLALGFALVCDDKLAGIHSASSVDCKLPGIFAGVPHSKTWIEEQIRMARGGASNLQASLAMAFAALLAVLNTTTY